MIWFPIGLGLLLRLIQLWMPIVGVHSWRQADTAAMARHFALSQTPIWMPQIDWGGASAGYVESEFPLFPFLVSRLYQVFGLQEWLGRGLSVLCSVLTIWLVMDLGRRWFTATAGWWAGLFFAISPVAVYFGRTFQAEALLLLCGAGALVAHCHWRRRRAGWALLISWIGFTAAGLIKVLPLLWLGLPLLMVELTPNPHAAAERSQQQIGRGLELLRNPGFWLYGASALALVVSWYTHAYQLGQSSGLSFGFWGDSSDRSGLHLLLDANSWLTLTLRLVLRLLAVVGVPFLILGLREGWRQGGGRIAISGLLGVGLCTIATMRSSTVHEYYQLPLLLFSCPLIGLGWQRWQQDRRNRGGWLARMLLGFALCISLVLLSIDYWAVEHRQARDWMPLALTIRRVLPIDGRIVSATSTDPTLLNLARRQGWLIASKQLTPERIERWKAEGATHIAGSYRWDKTYRLQPDERRATLQRLASATPGSWVDENSETYLIPLEGLATKP